MQRIKNQTETAKMLKANLKMILEENSLLLNQIDFNEVESLMKYIQGAENIFIIAAGRSGFAMRAMAMRLMHFGLKVHFVGDTITPAIQSGDLLIAASGSGTTSTIVKAAERAHTIGAAVAVLTTQIKSPLAILADLILHIPAAEKQDHDNNRSRQYAGGLFEQFLLLLGDAIFHQLWKASGIPAAELWKRHANLE